MSELAIIADAIAADDDNPAFDLDRVGAPAHESDTRHPAAAYLGRLAPSSRRVQRIALTSLAHLLGVGRTRPLAEIDTWHLSTPWWHLRYAHTLQLFTRLQQPILRPRRMDERGRPPAVDVLAPRTRERHIAALRGVLKECWRLGLMPNEEYHRAIDLPSVEDHRLPAGRALTMGEIQALLTVCAREGSLRSLRDQALIAVLYGAGLRRSELTALTLADYTPTDRALRIKRGKGSKERIAYLPPGAQRTLDAWVQQQRAALGVDGGAGTGDSPLFSSFRKGDAPTGRALDDDSLHHVVLERAKEAGIAPCRPHDFRRTFIGDLLTAGVDIVTVQRLVGHADPETTARYDRRPEDMKREAVTRIHVPWVERA